MRIATKNTPYTVWPPKYPLRSLPPPCSPCTDLEKEKEKEMSWERILEAGLDGFRGDLDIKRKYMENEK